MKIFVAVAGTPLAFKLSAHKTDADKVVVKARHPEIGGILAQITGAALLGEQQGSHYFVSTFAREALLPALGKLFGEVFAGNLTIASPKALVEVQNLNEAEEEAAEDDGEEDD